MWRDQNFAETVPFHKVSTPENYVKLRYFTQCVQIWNIPALRNDVINLFHLTFNAWCLRKDHTSYNIVSVIITFQQKPGIKGLTVLLF